MKIIMKLLVSLKLIYIPKKVIEISKRNEVSRWITLLHRAGADVTFSPRGLGARLHRGHQMVLTLIILGGGEQVEPCDAKFCEKRPCSHHIN